MLGKLSISLIALALCGTASASTPAPSTDVAYAIANPLRPGAKAPYCEAQPETVDGCTFHSVAGATYNARLRVEAGEHWSASTSDAATIGLHTVAQAEAADGKTWQLIKVTPNPARDADTTVTFDRLSGEAGALKVVERRRISVMVHPH